MSKSQQTIWQCGALLRKIWISCSLCPTSIIISCLLWSRYTNCNQLLAKFNPLYYTFYVLVVIADNSWLYTRTIFLMNLMEEKGRMPWPSETQTSAITSFCALRGIFGSVRFVLISIWIFAFVLKSFLSFVRNFLFTAVRFVGSTVWRTVFQLVYLFGNGGLSRSPSFSLSQSF